MNIPRRPLGFRESFLPTLSLPTLNLSINFPEKVFCPLVTESEEKMTSHLHDSKAHTAFCANALETIMTLYSKDMWLHIYTDGSAQEDGSAGTGFFYEKPF
ncbi:hypothetical protein TNCV_341241 [Trichonephila clavipes]|nr:hypothetical protein TNCV_341241 [Trichonephila clavipes]